MKVADLNIGTRLGMSFGFVLLLMTLLMAAGVGLLGSVGTANEHMINDVIRQERLVREWRHATEMNGLRTTVVARSETGSDQSALEAQIKSTSERISAFRKELDGLVVEAESRQLYAATADRRAAYSGAREAVLRARAAGDAEATRKLLDSQLAPAQAAYVASVAALASHFETKAAATAHEVQAQSSFGQYLLGGLWLAALLAGVTGTLLTTRSITRPLQRAMEIAQTIARGDLGARIDVHSRDETGQLLEALGYMNASLVRIIGEVRRGADVIASASTQISGGNLELSARTEQQASALEETASSMEQLTSSVRHNADNARQAYAMAQSSSGVAEQGGEMVQRVVQTMGAISASSRRIVDIIGVIDGIAFQTNILALNAAVEAARAGEQGRGFAVVASEVRNLAQRSAAAAREIKALIDDSVEQVDSGSKLVDQAGVTMREIVGSIGRVTDIMNEIMAASVEQSDGIAQVNDAIGQMDGVTQQNAALVEEAAAAAQALQEQAGSLAQSVSVFKLAPAVGAVHATAARLIQSRTQSFAEPGVADAAVRAPVRAARPT
jgi:methyl-accepting chemotaxis protein